MEKLLSFIVPVYKTEEYVIRCLTSLENQNIDKSDYEIIIVIDGSPDNSLLLISDFAKQYDNIKIIIQENQGLSVARNNGFLKATGRFIWFIDSDDFIASNCLCGLISFCEKVNCDLLGVGPSIPAVSDFPEQISENDISQEYSGKEWLLSDQAFIGAWAYIIKRSFWAENKLSFVPGIYYEDIECMSRAFYFANSIFTLNTFSVYNYVQHPDSIMNSGVSRKKIFDNLVVSASLRNFATNIKDSDIQQYYEKICTGCFIFGINMLAKNYIDIKVAKEFVAKAKIAYPKYLYAESIVHKLYQWIVVHYPVCYIRIRRFLS